VALGVVAAACVAAAGAAPQRFTAGAMRAYTLTGDDALFMPTGVTVGPDGRVYVSDGVHDRIVVFNADGSLQAHVSQVGSEPLANPTSTRLDRAGRLWIVDAGHRRVVVRAADGALDRVIAVPGPADAPPDLTDLALSPDEAVLWLVDNNHNQLIRHNLSDGRFVRVGVEGEALGQFHYPFALTTARNGDVIVTDVINGRAEVLTPEGAPTGSIGSYGLELGQFYRPKGVAVDPHGNVWIADGTLNVVQAFTSDGRLIDVLRDAQGQPQRFELPMGLAFDSSGALYVVELMAQRVQRVEVQVDPAAPAARALQREGNPISAQGHACTICHLEWTRPLADGRATELMAVPDNPASNPLVSRSRNCLSCHDGSVADSRRRVWVEHGHRTGIVPPAGITVPAQLPLVDGRIQCRTCHTAHALPDVRTRFEEVVFLRVKTDAAELCMGCHSTYGNGSKAGMHPLTPPATSAPGHLTTQPVAGQVSCFTCHTGHGTTFAHLLLRNVQTNDTCLPCHMERQPELFGDDVRSAHGRRPTLDAAQQAATAAFGGHLGARQELLCVTCHRPHGAPTSRALLAFDLATRDACAECHTDKARLVGSPHDMRKDHGDVPNALGVTPAEGGACAGCHGGHRYAQTPLVTPTDSAGRCAPCHRSDGLAAAKVLDVANHPDKCVGCHDPHETRFGKFLAGRPADRCHECHADHDIRTGVPHDVTHRPQLWPAAAREKQDACLACHRPHGSAATGLFRVVSGEPNMPNAGCSGCHQDQLPASGTPTALVHPQHSNQMPQTQLPLVKGAAGPELGCKTCHNPHGGASLEPGLLRVTGKETAQDLCFNCHADKRYIRSIGHAPQSLTNTGFNAGACRPCHVVHGGTDRVEPRLLWPKTLSEYPDRDPNTSAADHYCRSCHRTGGPVAPPATYGHPQADMFNADDPNKPGYLPLFNAAGEVDPQGKIACRTCHLTHGRSTPAAIPANLANLPPREMRARAWHIRSFSPDCVCSTCHGVDAIRRFMYFHDASRRSGPLDRR
jgi:predicted CXXCH cytochrome family protein